MGLFEEFRDPGWNTYYSDRPTPPELDVKTTIITYLAVVLAAAILMIAAGTRGHEVSIHSVIALHNFFLS